MSMFCEVQPVGVVELEGEDVAAPVVDPLGGLGQAGGVAGDAHASPEQGAERFADVADVDAGVAVPGVRGGDRRDFERARAVAIELGDDVLGRAGADRRGPRAGCSRPADWRRGGPSWSTSPAAQRPGRVVRPCRSTVTPPIM